MTDTSASPSDAADTIAELTVQLRLDTYRATQDEAEFGGANNWPADMRRLQKVTRDDTLVECLGHVLGATEEAAESYIARWARANGIESEAAVVRIQQMPSASQLARQRAEAEILTTLRGMGEAGLSKTALFPLLGKLGWREEEGWIEEALSTGKVLERRRGRGTIYVHSDFAAPRAEDQASTAP